MTSLHKQIFVCVDCETTGLDVEQDRIIEVGAVRFTLDQELARYQTLVDPERPISKESIEIHHITNEMVAGEPKIQEVAPAIRDFLQEGIIVGHGVTFDLQMLQAAGLSFEGRKVIDTLRLARHYGESPTSSLEALRRHFNIPAQAAHRALDDADVNVAVFKRLVERFKTTQEVFQTLEKPILLKTMPLGRHKGRPFSEVPLDYLKWAAGKDFDQDLLFSIRFEIKRRKQGTSFRQSSNPFHGL